MNVMSEQDIKYDVLRTIEGNYPTMLNVMYRNRRKWQPANPKHLLSYIPGTIVSIHVSEGQKVAKGEEVMIFKAMKMDNRVKSPMDGRIAKIHVKEGGSVPKGVLMIEFE